jgi:hypothetical protein
MEQSVIPPQECLQRIYLSTFRDFAKKGGVIKLNGKTISAEQASSPSFALPLLAFQTTMVLAGYSLPYPKIVFEADPTSPCGFVISEIETDHTTPMLIGAANHLSKLACANELIYDLSTVAETMANVAMYSPTNNIEMMHAPDQDFDPGGIEIMLGVNSLTRSAGQNNNLSA